MAYAFTPPQPLPPLLLWHFLLLFFNQDKKNKKKHRWHSFQFCIQFFFIFFSKCGDVQWNHQSFFSLYLAQMLSSTCCYCRDHSVSISSWTWQKTESVEFLGFSFQQRWSRAERSGKTSYRRTPAANQVFCALLACKDLVIAQTRRANRVKRCFTLRRDWTLTRFSFPGSRNYFSSARTALFSIIIFNISQKMMPDDIIIINLIDFHNQNVSAALFCCDCHQTLWLRRQFCWCSDFAGVQPFCPPHPGVCQAGATLGATTLFRQWLITAKMKREGLGNVTAVWCELVCRQHLEGCNVAPDTVHTLVTWTAFMLDSYNSISFPLVSWRNAGQVQDNASVAVSAEQIHHAGVRRGHATSQPRLAVASPPFQLRDPAHSSCQPPIEHLFI